MRGAAMGVLVRRKKGSDKWWVFINRRGRRASLSYDTKAQADAVAVESARLLALADIAGYEGPIRTVLAQAAGTISPGEEMTVAEYAKEWQAVNTNEDGWSPTTGPQYDSVLRCRILPTFGHMLLHEVKKRAVKVWLAEMSTPTKGADGKIIKRAYSPNTVRNALRVFSSLMNSAVEDELIKHSPVSNRQLSKVKKKKKPVKAWTVEELGRISAAADQCLSYRDRCLLEFLMETGARGGEACGLQWGDFDFVGHHVMLQRQFVKGIVIPHTKNRAFRKLAISQELINRFKRLRTEQSRDALRRGNSPPEWVFATSNGTLVSSDRFRRRPWKRLVKRAQVIDHKPHGLRHTWITHALKVLHPEEVARRAGHSTTMMLDTYSPVLEDRIMSTALHPLRVVLHPIRTLAEQVDE